ncbi:MAG TPA: GNAT family protein [Methanoregula sp.]|nr:GNAT family protein [Methanoregula sp.]
MIALRPVTPHDIAAIKQWPPYPPEFRDLDYALRDDGWLDEYAKKAGAEILIADDDGKVAGFSIIAEEPGGSSEFRIALHPELLGKGTGGTIAALTLAHGFSDPATRIIHLIVRKNNPRAKRLYERLHFRTAGECVRDVQGRPVAFYRMEIDRAAFLKEEGT